MLIVVAFGLVIAASTSLRGAIVKRDIEKMTSIYKTERKASFEANINSAFELTDIFARDYSVWDDMVKAVKSGDEAWFDENIIPALDTYKASAAWVVDKSFNLKYQITKDEDVADYPLPFDFKKDGKKIFQDGNFVETFTTFDDNVYRISIGPIQPSSDSQRKTEPQGYFIAAKQLNSDFISHLEKLNLMDIRLHAGVHDPEANEIDKGVVKFNYGLQDLGGERIAHFQIAAQSDFLKSYYRDQLAQYWFSVAGIAVLVLTFGIFIYVVVSLPLREVSDTIRYGGGNHLEKIIKRRDEIGDIARLVQQNVSQSQETKIAYQKIEQAQREANSHLAEVEQMNNLMVGRELRMSELKKENEQLKKLLDEEGQKHGSH